MTINGDRKRRLEKMEADTAAAIERSEKVVARVERFILEQRFKAVLRKVMDAD